MAEPARGDPDPTKVTSTTLDNAAAQFWQSPSSRPSTWLTSSATQAEQPPWQTPYSRPAPQTAVSAPPELPPSSTYEHTLHTGRPLEHGSFTRQYTRSVQPGTDVRSRSLAYFHKYGTLEYPLHALSFGPPYETYPGPHCDYPFPAGPERQASGTPQITSDFIDPYKDYHPNDISLQKPRLDQLLTPISAARDSEPKTPHRSGKSLDTPTRTQPVRQTRVTREGVTPEGTTSTKRRGAPHLLPHTAESIYLNLMSCRRELADSTTSRRRNSLQNEIKKAEGMMKRAVLVKGEGGNVLYKSFDEYRLTLDEAKFAQPVFGMQSCPTQGLER